MVLDIDRDSHRRREQIENRAEDFWHEFLSKVAVRAENPWTALATLMPELHINFGDESDEVKEYEFENELPPPEPEEIDDLEAWLAEHMSGTITGSEIRGEEE